MSDPTVSYRSRLAATPPEAELEVLGAVYSFLIQRHVNREAAASVGCAGSKGGENNQSKAPSGSGGPSATDRRGDGSDKPSERGKEVKTN
jgi:hypothetical protein